MNKFNFNLYEIIIVLHKKKIKKVFWNVFIIRRFYLFHFSYPEIFFFKHDICFNIFLLPFGSVTHFSTVIYIQRYLKSERHPLFLAIIQQFATFHLYLSMWVVFSFLNVALTVSNWFMYCSCNSNFFSFKMDMLNNRHNTPRMTRLARDIV